ncbi:hypothetical protein [Saccharopolyspora antimicrobica]|uniref:hypothetical protein n=1 Tax=Saccharopolyspora antimicrobica TaxID=455193 RepID=UPI001FE50CB6|nr:hypothetical protein [Saccharopolyspora antimicrobica]
MISPGAFQASYSHLMPLVLPVADLARRAGHEVAVATGPGMAEHIRRIGVRALTLPNAVTRGDIAKDPELTAEAGIARPTGHPGSATRSQRCPAIARSSWRAWAPTRPASWATVRPFWTRSSKRSASSR